MESEMNSTIARLEEVNGSSAGIKNEAGLLYDFHPDTDYMVSTVRQLRDDIAKLE